MGVKNLWDILESCKKTLPLHHLQNKRICVDLSCWLIQLKNSCKSPVAVKEKIYLRGLFHRLRALIALNCSLILVTDGSIPSIKLSTYRRRLGLSSEVALEEGNSQAVAALRRNKGSEFSCMIKEAKVLCLALGIPCLDGLEEAEAQCALLNSEFICDGCFSADSDIFLFGARTVYRDIFLGDGGYVICYDMADIERNLGFGRNSLISLALLLGGDYSQRVNGFGPDTACKIVKSVGNEKILHQIISEGLTIKKQGKKKKEKFLSNEPDKENKLSQCQDSDASGFKIIGSNGQFLEVINAYLKPKCHSAESDVVQSVCVEHPFHRTELQQICEKFFGWSPNRTDEYILPKIAERDLRRFANLRITSLVLGQRIPLHKIPLPCPISSIVKQRKMHGKECFEVSWQNFGGLQTSIVPADLVESACPEKIAEFMDRKADNQRQKRKSRQRKSSKATISEVDTQLQCLMLSIESQNLTIPNATKDAQLQDMKQSVESRCSADPNASECNQHQTAAVIESEVIDLSSPSPPIRACKVAKLHKLTNHPVIVIDVTDDVNCQEDEHQNIDSVEICESDTDVSSEHERKARELRLFIESIRGEL